MQPSIDLNQFLYTTVNRLHPIKTLLLTRQRAWGPRCNSKKTKKKHVSWLVVETEKNRYRLDRCLFLKKGRQLLASKWNIHTQRRQKHSFEQKILQYFLVKHCDQNKPFFNFGGANIEIRQRAYQLLDILSIFIVGTLFSILPVRFGVAWPLAEIEDFASSN